VQPRLSVLQGNYGTEVLRRGSDLVGPLVMGNEF
jgi:hypothetical protein